MNHNFNKRMGEKIVSVSELVKLACENFERKFGGVARYCGCAPGRVNLIGEHIDYNDGFVLPMALPLVTVMVGCPTNSSRCRVLTLSNHADHSMFAEFDLPSLESPLKPGIPAWANYVKGVVANFNGQNSLCGFDAVVSSSVPVGGGLSSSAALEAATYTFLEALCGALPTVSLTDKALICQKAEHDFPGMPCGIMDQFIAFMGKMDHALLVDCRSLESRLVPFKNPEVTILITNSNVRHSLTGSEYPTRRRNCEEAARIMGKKSLRDVTLENLEDFQNKLTEEMYRQVHHVVMEIHRTKQSAEALEAGDYKMFGKWMFESHESLSKDYKVSCPELDELVKVVANVEGVYGSRMTGAGFGGCTVTLLKTAVVQEAINEIKSKYHGHPTFYVCHPGDGARVINLE
ncbi:galactokinase-like [Limulus polyphemus]|uniref:Galactokinase-like n=1 Tax=Limulus polyphemus TaxID=6850 RepID=A0ABM1BG46_LIMPO|nr:galactokinase-like [Limulus polyphemus]